MKDKTGCFTGHRTIPQENIAGIQKRLEDEIVNLIHQGVIYYGCGGAVGFDTLAALTILKLKMIDPRIKLILVLPCKNQTKSWCEQDVERYKWILAQADKVVYTSECYVKGCMHKRNRHLVDNSGYCICYLTAKTGGTAYTVGYAMEKGLRVVHIE